MAHLTTAIKTMAVTDLMELREKVETRLSEHRKALEKQLTALGGLTSGVRESTRNGRHSPMKGKSVPVTHRGPEKGQEWRGRGMMPRWMQALIKQGHSPDEYRVGAKAAAAVKKTAKKTSRGRKAKKRAKAK